MMPVQKVLPSTYQEYRKHNFTRESMTYLSNNVLMAVMMIFFFVIFSRYTQSARTDFQPVEFLSIQGWEWLWIFVLAMVMMFAHKGIQLLSFKGLGAEDAVLLTKGFTPHVLAAKQYFTKWPYVIAKLMPIIVLSLIYLLLAPIIPYSWIEMSIYFFAFNVAYATTDLISIVEAIRGPRNVLIEDVGENVYFYADKEFVDKLRKKKGIAPKKK